MASNLYNSQENVRQAYLKALNVAVPEAYRRAQGDMGPAMYTTRDDPRAILLSLQRRYGKMTPKDKEEATLQWSRPWNPSELIEQMFFNLEELYIQAVIADVPYTMVQLMDKALNKIKKTGVFRTNVTAWAARNRNDKNWQNLKAHFIAAYDAHLESGPIANTAGYHGAAAAGPQRRRQPGLDHELRRPDAHGKQRQHTRNEQDDVHRKRRDAPSPCHHAATSGGIS